jgi:hypothetical protein
MLSKPKKAVSHKRPRHLAEKKLLKSQLASKKLLMLLGEPSINGSQKASPEEISEWFEKALSEIDQDVLNRFH